MPTGLTSKICDGSDTSFRSFALACLAQIGYGYRASNGGDTPLPRYHAPELKPNVEYDTKQLRESEVQLELLRAALKDPERMRKEYDSFVEALKESSESYESKNEEVRKRYLDMRNKVFEWDAPEDCQGLKDLMLRQIDESISFDCHEPRKYDYHYSPPSIEKWIQMQIEGEERSVKYHTEEIQKEKEFVKGANEFFKTVYAEIDKVDPPSYAQKIAKKIL